MDPIIELSNVSVIYQAGQSNQVFGSKDINLKIFPQEYAIFFGPSGSGKSTLLNLIAGLEKPTTGQVIVNGHDLAKFHEDELIRFHRTMVGIIFQAFYLISSLSIKDNILLPQIFMRSAKEPRLAKMKDMAARFGITDILSKKPSQLSGGQQQRVAAARALINDPNIILADEPVGNLDSKNAELTMELLNKLNQEFKKTIILVTHDPRYLVYADRIFYIKDGQLEKEVKNPNKQTYDKKASGFDLLSRTYPYLTNSQIHAKLVVNEVVMPFDYSQIAQIEDWVNQYIQKNITIEALRMKLDESQEKGGLALYKQSAQKIADRVQELVEEIQLVDNSANISLDKEIARLKEILISDFSLHLTELQTSRLAEFLTQRFKGTISSAELAGKLDLSLENGGTGLNKRTVAKLIREIDVVLAKI